MSAKAARSFYVSLMTREQIEQLHLRERQLAPRSLAPCEISELFNLTVGPKKEEEWKYVEQMENDHGKLIWKYRNLEKIGQAPARDDMDELHDFDEFVSLNWNYAQTPTMGDYK